MGPQNVKSSVIIGMREPELSPRKTGRGLPEVTQQGRSMTKLLVQLARPPVHRERKRRSERVRRWCRCTAI